MNSDRHDITHLKKKKGAYGFTTKPICTENKSTAKSTQSQF